MDLTNLLPTLSAIRAYLMGAAEVKTREAEIYTELDMLREQLKMKATELAELQIRTGQVPPETPAGTAAARIIADVMGTAPPGGV